jgi:RHH-type transcriptional regulator, rel operon repressor / antitoxin RelB
MLTVRLDPDTEEQLNALAEQTGRSKSYYVKEAIAEYLVDRADYLKALAVLEKKEPRTNSKVLRKALGLDR